MPRYSEVPVKKQRAELYGPTFGAETLNQRADDIRRKLIIDYSVHPNNRRPNYEKKDTWKEIARYIIDYTGGGEELIMLDAGASSGYMIDQALRMGFMGRIVGADIEASHMHLLDAELAKAHPIARVDLGHADAESLDIFTDTNGLRHEIPNDFFDVTTELFIHHHTPHPEAAIEAALDVTKNGGLAIFGGRAVGHLDNVYFVAGLAANYFGLKPPRPYYKNYDFFMMKSYLEGNPRCRIIKEGMHANHIWIDGDGDGWNDVSNAVVALLPDMNRDLRKKAEVQDMREYLETTLKKGYFAGAIRYYNGYILDTVAQKYFAVEVTK